MLSVLIALPLLGAVLIGLLPQSIAPTYSRWIALTSTAIAFVWSIFLGVQFNASLSDLQFQETLPWIEVLGLDYRLGLDGLSLPLVVLNGLLTWIALYSTDRAIQRPKLYYILILLLTMGVVGAFLSQNLLLFFLFYELELIPLYFLIAIWGGARRGYAATKFLIYTALSGILILAAFLGLTWLSGTASFEYDVTRSQLLPLTTQLILLGTILVGFGIKIPLVPFHTWLPDAHVEASTPISVLLAGVLLKLGTYGLLRFGLQLFPEAWAVLAPWLASWAVVSVLYGAFTAIAQKDMKKMVAYSSIGHMGYVLLGVAALTPLSMVGAVSQMVSHGLILALLFYLVGVIETKVGTRELDVLNGLLNPIRGLPLTSALLILAGMASAGIPGMVGFVAEFLVFQGSFSAFPWPTLLAVIGTGLTAVYFVILLNRTCFGKLDSTSAYYPKVTFMEHFPALALTGLIIWLGIQPVWLVRLSESTTAAFVAATPAALTRQVALTSSATVSSAPSLASER